MYSRELASGPAHFGVSGKLWNGVLVMFDRETGSLWTQVDGRAIQGGLRGERLEHYPSEFTTWRAWRTAHPNTLVLVKGEEARAQEGSHYADYLSDPERLFLDELAEGLGGIEPKDTVFGIVLGSQAFAVTEAVLAREKIVNAVVAGAPVALLFEPETGFVRAVDRRLGQRVLVLAPIEGSDPRILFRDVLTGETHGADELELLRVDRAFWYAWARSHPGSRVLAD